jgi:hypothetical protein
MPVGLKSRYYGLPTYQIEDRRGQTTALALRPSLNPPSTTDYRHRVTALENLEYLAWRYYGSSDDFWRILDANPVRFPLDLKPAEMLTVPVGADTGLVQRTRRF